MFFDLSILKSSRQDTSRHIILPNQLTEELAEFMGIHYGDGNLYFDGDCGYRISYSGDLFRDIKYLEHINGSFSNLFNLNLHKKDILETNTRILEIYSKTIYNFMVKFLEIPSGPKIDLRFPTILESKPLFKEAFLRGLFDTDGCFVIQKQGKYRYPLVKISMKSKIFAEDINQVFRDLNYNSYVCKKSNPPKDYEVVIRSKDVHSFFNKIKPNNKRKVGYYNDFIKKYGFMGI